MEYIELKNTDLKVSRLCVGGCPMGGYGWGNVQERELIDAVHSAMENGITMFDTADTYGLGQSEITLGKALGKRRKDVVIADKFGVRVENGRTYYDNNPEYIRKAINSSLQRLNTDYIDLYQVHYRDTTTSLAVVVDTLEELKREGKIRYYGLSNIHQEDFGEIKQFIGKFASVQNEYSLACRKNEKELQSLCAEYHMTPLTWGSLGQGILTGKYDKTTVFDSSDRRSRDVYVNFHGNKLLNNLEIVECMRPIAQKYGKPISAVAIRFILDWIKESVVLVGAKRPSQILDNIKSCDWNLSKEELHQLDYISNIEVL